MKIPSFGIRFYAALPAVLAITLASPQAATRNVTAKTVTTLHKWIDSADVYTNNNYVIQLSAGTYTLTKTLKMTKGYVTLKGSSSLTGAPKYILEGGFPNGSGFKRMVHVEGASGWYPSFEIRGITIRGGYVTGDGAGVYAYGSGYVSLTNCYIRDNTASSYGSGIYVGTGASVSLNSSVVSGNINYQSMTNMCGGVTSSGGGVAVIGGVFSSNQSTFMGNQACRGAGASIYSGFATFENSTFSSNNANKRGGGLFIAGGWVTMRFNTIAYNKAGVYSADPSGFYEEKYGAGIAMDAFTGNFNFFGNILAKNQTVNSDKAKLGYHGHDCFRKGPGIPVTQHMDNLIGAVGNCAVIGSGAPFQGSETTPVDPLLDPNLTLKTGTYGNQYTHSLQNGSWAIGMYFYNSAWGYHDWPEYCLYADQLGHRRDWYNRDSDAPQKCDMGAQVYNWIH
jgi:hypothetical protein